MQQIPNTIIILFIMYYVMKFYVTGKQIENGN